MAMRSSCNSRNKQRRGKGEFGNYKSWESVIEHTSFAGVRSIEKDWRTGRDVQLLSQTELKVWLLLNFNPYVAQVKEHFPLEKNVTDMITEHFGWNYSKNLNSAYTTDFLVYYKNGTTHAFAVVSNEHALDRLSTCRRLIIEKTYWGLKKVPFDIVFADKISQLITDNIYQVTRYYDVMDVQDKVSAMKFLIANRIFEMKPNEMNCIIDYTKMAEIYVTADVEEAIEKAKESSMARCRYYVAR